MMSTTSFKGNTNWDPTRSSDWDSSTPLPLCLKRMTNDLAVVMEDEAEQAIYVQPEEKDVTKLYALVVGPSDTPYEGGFFKFFVRVGPDYPLKPPRVKNLTTANGTVGFGPNLYSDGKVCLSILGTWSGPSWTPVMNIRSTLLSVRSLMSEGAFRNEPGNENLAMTDPNVIQYDQQIQHEVIRVAVIESVETALNPSQTFWSEKLRKIVLESFMKNYDVYLRICDANMGMDRQPLNGFCRRLVSQVYSGNRTFEWNSMKGKLSNLKLQVQKYIANSSAGSPIIID